MIGKCLSYVLNNPYVSLDRSPSVARWLVCHWGGGGGGGGGANTQTAAPPPAHTHTNKHAACLSVRISYLVTGADARFWRGGGGFDMDN